MNTKHSILLLPLLLTTGLYLPSPTKGQLLPLLSSFHSSGTGFNMSSVEPSGLLARQQRVCPAGYPVIIIA
ncbi:hypothetical protein CPB86DRAFT_605414 [Serendipita vermifera]|nr:hypothetical protein CPB86DRAFT_605414 [Serendipita vermifera]